MTRIAAGLLIVATALVFNGGLMNGALAEDQAMKIRLEASKTDNCAVAEPRATRVMSLLICLQALQPQPAGAAPKV
ncbi:MAG: hypothetical protein ABIO40_11695 [Devosia sp.]